jgi:hypothetical protein
MGIKEIQLPMQSLSALAQSVVDYETEKALCRRVDGHIIGTGKSDFTQGNVTYTLEYEGKTFQLVDVPGIEGDESRFTGLVQAAVAKAHLVFFVNGTNKKPEKATAEKIRSYLRRGSHVCPLVNVRGSADTYEFEEDRESLVHSGADVTLKQTETVLASVLGEDSLLPGHCVQGLMGFSSLAFDPHSDSTTIHPSRDSSLVRQQRNYLKYFESTSEMYHFSQVESVANVLRGKLSTFKEDIVESNKSKVRELLDRNIVVLKDTVEAHKSFIADVSLEFEKCRAAIEEAVISFERISLSTRRNNYNELFNKLIEESDRVVEENFGDAPGIKQGIEEAFEQCSGKAESKLEKDLGKSLTALQSQLEQSVTRLLEDVERVKLEQQMRSGHSGNWRFQHSGPMGWNLGLGDFGSFAFQIGSYATTGALIGAPFGPPLGAIIGGAVGAAVGAIMALVNLFMSKAKRIRKSQSEVRKKIEKVQDQKLAEVAKEVAALMTSIRQDVEQSVSLRVDDLEEALHLPVSVLENQISMMCVLKDKIEKMPYGTTQEV